MSRFDSVLTRVAALALASAFAAAPARADDATLERRVADRLAKERLERDADVRASVAGGRVVLEGVALTVDARRRAEKAARKETKAVENRIRVVPEEVPDAQIQKAVEAVILRQARYGVFDAIGAQVQNGAVTLSGSVYQGFLKDDVEREVGKLAGVRSVKNAIAIQPASLFDDRLRVALARRIYNDPQFVHYGTWVNPPVRILVANGRVTLVGEVASRVEREVIGHIARGFPAFAVDNQLLVESEKEKEPARKAARES
jgi:osmotically-inducible protein OsmY